MDISASAWSNGCESGWTGYLDESHQWQQNTNKNNIGYGYDYDYGYYSPSHGPDSTCRREEDLSMVSDASSGPPHLVEDDQHRHYLFNTVKKKVVGEKRSKKNTSEHKNNKAKQRSNCCDNNNKYENNLDDTASSPALNYSKMCGYASHNHVSQEHFMGFSNNLSTTHFEGNSAYNNQYGFWQSPHQETANYAEPSYSKGRRWE